MPQKMELSPALAERIKTLFGAGQSRRKIATVLQEEGYAVPADSRRKTWHHSLVSMYLEQLGLVSPPTWVLKPGVLGEGAKRWDALLKAAPASAPSTRPAVSAAPARPGSHELVGPPQPAASSAPAAPPAQPADPDEVAARWEHALANASTPAAIAAEPPAQHSGVGSPPQPPPSAVATSAPGPADPPSLKLELDGPATAADRRLWFSLVRVARSELGQKPSHQLPRARALVLLPIGPPDPGPAELWAAMKRLRASGITWEARLQNRPLSMTAPLISGVLTDTALTFHFAPELVTLLLDEQQFVRVRTLIGREHDLPPVRL